MERPVRDIAVIMPARNAADTIAEAVESVLSQIPAVLELIVVDDGSTDATRDVLDSVMDPRVTVLSCPGVGCGAARNRGLDAARGELIAFMDADDVWLPGKLAAQVAVLESAPGAMVAYSWSEDIDVSGARTGGYCRLTRNGDVRRALLLRNFLGNGSTPLLYRSVLTETGGFDEALPACEDWDLWLRLAERHAFVCVPQTYVLYRRSEASMSSDLPLMNTTAARVIERAYDRAPAHLQSQKGHTYSILNRHFAVQALSMAARARSSARERELVIASTKYLYRSVLWSPMRSLISRTVWATGLRLLIAVATARRATA